MPKYLLVDDEKYPQNISDPLTFTGSGLAKLDPCDVDIARDLTEAKILYLENKYEALFIDYYLGFEGTGIDFLEWMELQDKPFPKSCIAVSGSSAGQNILREKLREWADQDKIKFYHAAETTDQTRCHMFVAFMIIILSIAFFN